MKNILCLALLLISFIVSAQSEKIKEDSLYYEKIIKINDEIEEILYHPSSQKEIKNKEESVNSLYKKN